MGKKKVRFYFNPESLTYVRIRVPKWSKILKVLAVSASSSLVILLAFSIYVYQHKTPNEKKLYQKLNLYKQQISYLNGQLEKLNGSLTDLQKKDNQIYRVIFEADPLSDQITEAGIGGTNNYNDLALFEGTESLVQTNQKVDKLSAKLSILNQSYNELIKLAKAKERMLASIPAIQPVSNKDLDEIASGFGMRIHPIYKTLRMHEGLDFAAPKGTDVYATGDGVVEKVEFEASGYGNAVTVNHGFGYKTIYGHLTKWLVRPGQKVKRGEIIGLVGSTGLSTAPHLHYEVEKNGKKINPINYFHNDLDANGYERIIKLANQANQSFD